MSADSEERMEAFVPGERITGIVCFTGGIRGTGTFVEIDDEGDYKIEHDGDNGPAWLKPETVERAGPPAHDSLNPDPHPLPERAKVLREAEALITGDRNRSYGEPTQNFQDIAEGWNILLRHKLKEGSTIDPGDTAAMMILVKLVRRTAGDSRDNWVDTAGYAGCGAQCDSDVGRTP
jgi:hypothetical protein